MDDLGQSLPLYFCDDFKSVLAKDVFLGITWGFPPSMIGLYFFLIPLRSVRIRLLRLCLRLCVGSLKIIKHLILYLYHLPHLLVRECSFLLAQSDDLLQSADHLLSFPAFLLSTVDNWGEGG